MKSEPCNSWNFCSWPKHLQQTQQAEKKLFYRFITGGLFEGLLQEKLFLATENIYCLNF